jgi:hypothetical protein
VPWHCHLHNKPHGAAVRKQAMRQTSTSAIQHLTPLARQPMYHCGQATPYKQLKQQAAAVAGRPQTNGKHSGSPYALPRRLWAPAGQALDARAQRQVGVPGAQLHLGVDG